MSRRPRRDRPGPLVRVEWQDIQEDSTWQESWAPKGRLCQCVSVGWMTHKDSDLVVLVTSFGDDEADESRHRTSGGVISIPRGCVTRIVRLEDPR